MTMGSTKHNSISIGLDQLAPEKARAAAWSRARSDGFLALLLPSVPVRVLGADGQQSVWFTRGVVVDGKAGDHASARFTAVELPDDFVLRRTLQLPALTDQEVAQAAQLEVEGASPFASSDLAWGHGAVHVGNSITVDIAMASRLQALGYLETVAAKLQSGSQPEVWAFPGDSPPIVLGGFGELRRLGQSSLRQRATIALLVLAVAMLLVIAATPVLQLRLRALEAVTAYDASVKRAEPLLRQRAGLSATLEKVGAIKAILVESGDPLYVMALLTEILPDDTSLLGVQMQGSKVTINGLTANAAALMQQLGSRPELRDVKAPTPATRSPGSPKDVFNVEFTLTRTLAPSGDSAATVGAATVGAVTGPNGGIPGVGAVRPAASVAAPAAAALSATQSATVAVTPRVAPPVAPAQPIGGSPSAGPVFGAPDPQPGASPKAR